jgi:hypothetical protein
VESEEQVEKADAPPSAEHDVGFARRHWGKLTIFSVIALPILGFVAWVLITLNYSYSTGDRAGFLQKLSKRGWVCKTWEGEMLLSAIPGSQPEKFIFTVRSDSLANEMNKLLGKQVALTYAQHQHVPTSCWGDTEYYITAVRAVR